MSRSPVIIAIYFNCNEIRNQILWEKFNLESTNIYCSENRCEIARKSLTSINLESLFENNPENYKYYADHYKTNPNKSSTYLPFRCYLQRMITSFKV